MDSFTLELNEALNAFVTQTSDEEFIALLLEAGAERYAGAVNVLGLTSISFGSTETVASFELHTPAVKPQNPPAHINRETIWLGGMPRLTPDLLLAA